jgi:hypothetical protein
MLILALLLIPSLATADNLAVRWPYQIEGVTYHQEMQLDGTLNFYDLNGTISGVSFIVDSVKYVEDTDAIFAGDMEDRSHFFFQIEWPDGIWLTHSPSCEWFGVPDDLFVDCTTEPEVE